MPSLKCLMLTSYSDDDALLDAIMAGASGYLLKQVHGGDLVAAVRTLASGGSLIDSRLTATVMERLRAASQPKDPFDQLTAQEHRVLDLIGDGLTNRQIADRLSLAEKTVKNYVSGLFAKLGVERRVQAALLVSAERTRHRAHPR
jgi:DNA-binding NarL/FixJ family response regulator